MKSLLEQSRALLKETEAMEVREKEPDRGGFQFLERQLRKPLIIKFRPETPDSEERVVVYKMNGEIDVATFIGGRWKNTKNQTLSNVKAWFTPPAIKIDPVEKESDDDDEKDKKESFNNLTEEEIEVFWEEALELCPSLGEKREPSLIVGSVKLDKHERPIDYGHCGQIMKDKYGEEKGDDYYKKLIDHPKAGTVHFAIAQKIQKEKKKMMQDLGIYDGPQSLEKASYQDVRAKWLANQKQS